MLVVLWSSNALPSLFTTAVVLIYKPERCRRCHRLLSAASFLVVKHHNIDYFPLRACQAGNISVTCTILGWIAIGIGIPCLYQVPGPDATALMESTRGKLGATEFSNGVQEVLVQALPER